MLGGDVRTCFNNRIIVAITRDPSRPIIDIILFNISSHQFPNDLPEMNTARSRLFKNGSDRGLKTLAHVNILKSDGVGLLTR